MEAVAYHQNEIFKAATLFARTERFVVAPETAHSVKAAIDFARICKRKNEKKIIVFANSGHGHFDLAAYDNYNNNRLQDYKYPNELIRKAMNDLPKI